MKSQPQNPESGSIRKLSPMQVLQPENVLFFHERICCGAHWKQFDELLPT